MAVPRSILVAVDFSEASARAITVAGLIAERCGATTLRLVHAESIEAPIYFTSEQLDRLERERQLLHRQAEEFLSRFGRQHTSAPFSVRVDALPPVDAILHESTASDLVVMGTHGRRGPKRWWLGSVAERVLREINRPLLIVRAALDHPDGALFKQAIVYAPSRTAAATTRQFADGLSACLGGEVISKCSESIEAAIEGTKATIILTPLPAPRTTAWLSEVGEALVRFSSVPILFVPDLEGASS
jgi:nucleotide-binding universal stress UspA family protein